jgi:hypothetical protein
VESARKEPSIEILGAGEFEGPHWHSLRRRDTANKWKDSSKPRPILVKRGDIAAEVERYLSDCVFIPAVERARRLSETQDSKRVQWWDSPTGKKHKKGKGEQGHGRVRRALAPVGVGIFPLNRTVSLLLRLNLIRPWERVGKVYS